MAVAEQHNVSNAGESQDVAIEASQGTHAEINSEAGADSEAIAQQAVTGYALIDHRYLRTSGHFFETMDEITGPIAVRIRGGPIAIRDGVTKRNDEALGRLSRNQNSSDQD